MDWREGLDRELPAFGIMQARARKTLGAGYRERVRVLAYVLGGRCDHEPTKVTAGWACRGCGEPLVESEVRVR